VRQLAAILGLAALASGFAGTAFATTETTKERRKQEQKLARVMAIAEVDFALRRAELGLVGSTLGGVAQASGPRVPPSSRPPVDAVVTPASASAPAAGDAALR
jgi:hypothetical protein